MATQCLAGGCRTAADPPAFPPTLNPTSGSLAPRTAGDIHIENVHELAVIRDLTAPRHHLMLMACPDLQSGCALSNGLGLTASIQLLIYLCQRSTWMRSALNRSGCSGISAGRPKGTREKGTMDPGKPKCRARGFMRSSRGKTPNTEADNQDFSETSAQEKTKLKRSSNNRLRLRSLLVRGPQGQAV